MTIGFNQTGTFDFYCVYHPYMVGTITAVACSKWLNHMCA